MINRILVRKYIGQSSLLFYSCGIALFAFAWVRVWVVSLLDMGQFRTILEQFREFEKFAPIDFDAVVYVSRPRWNDIRRTNGDFVRGCLVHRSW